MNSNDIGTLKSILCDLGPEVNDIFYRMDHASPSAEGDGEFEELEVQLHKAYDSFGFMESYAADMVVEALTLMKSLRSAKGVVKRKLENPYMQSELVTFSFPKRRHHAYL